MPEMSGFACSGGYVVQFTGLMPYVGEDEDEEL